MRNFFIVTSKTSCLFSLPYWCGSEAGREWAVNLCLSERGLPVKEISRYLEKIFLDRAGDGAVAIFRPRLGLPVVIDGDNKIYLIGGHSADILGARVRQPLHMPELGMGMKIPDNLKAVKPGKDGVDFFMAPIMRYYALRPSGGRLEAEGMLDYKAVFEPIAEQKAQAFPFIYLRRTQQ